MPQDISFTVDKTFTAASANGVLADNSTSSQWVQIGFGEGPSGATDQSVQAIAFTGILNDANGTASLIAKVSVPDGAGATETVIYEESATVAVTAKRTGTDGASGNYLATISWSGTNLKTFDCLLAGACGKGAKLYFICTALGTATSFRIIGVGTRNAG